MKARLSEKNKLSPTMQINNIIETKNQFFLLMSFLFINLEILVSTIIFFSLFTWRTVNEFDILLTWQFWSMPRFSQYFAFYLTFIIMHLGLVFHYGIIQFSSSSGFADELFKIFKSYGFAILTAIGISFLMKFADFSRLVIISYWGVSLLTSIVIRGIRRTIYLRLASSGKLSKNVLIVGAGKIGKSLMDELNTHKWLGYKVIGYVDDSFYETYRGINHLGPIKNLKHVLYHMQHVDELIITIPSERQLVNELITDLRKLNINIKIVPDMFNLVTSTVQLGTISALPIVTLIKTPMRGPALIIKRLIDLFLSINLVILGLPLLLTTALAIKLDSPGPVLYKQVRIGKNGKQFYMYKFRSMVQGADQMTDKLQDENEINGPAFKIKNDPRKTKVGAFIRKYSIDELPQILNVIAGHMSLVGPRPPLPREVEQYGDWEWRRLEVVPGITGLWQVSGRSDLSFQQWINLDIYYIEHWNLVLDLKILIKTLPVVLKGEGAY